ncbi:phosphoglycerol transferase MdoB-like AlkP superfamily enzyme [Marinomonas alcarazii]|uniref:Phosphoglycerol transferase MdoB-like AlkP superfamily enzyme n=1 Tax=Marinomonas alcarazii TaxID=491949 RepID=A0A318V633_9GAMM|nr:alkaline phosphatase family protein [Marinomonas alcarazii]PYF82948.1 phosphoglycerol transferase MdoB-like AlkP superfamily enzyme [Marinomonas alcarazii]
MDIASHLNRKKININPLLFLILGLFCTFIGYILTRFYFLAANSGYYVSEPAGDVILALIHGLRFDLSAIALLNAPLLLLLFVSIWFRVLLATNMKLIFCYLFVVNVSAVVINFIDTVYFPYTGRRSGPEVFSMANDVVSQLPELIFVYWWYLLGTVLIYWIYFAIFRKVIRRLPAVCLNWFVVVLVLIILAFLLILAGRGGFQSKPIRALNAYSYPSSSLGSLVLNTPFSILKEDAEKLERVHYFESEDDIKKVLDNSKSADVTVNKDSSPITKQNVVILILESFGLEYFGPPYGLKPYTPFIQELAEKGRFFPNGIANGRRSIEAVPSILAGIPSLMPEAYMRSPYQSNTAYGLGEIVKQYGYSTAFFHGAKNGSMYFDSTTYRFGFDKYFGQDQYPDQSQFDGQWGIFDEPFLQFAVDELDKLPKPFMSGIFTISSHPPYTLPEQYQDAIPDGEIPMHRVVRYSDMALRKFFESAARKDWYKDTLFVLTADHTSDNFDPRFASSLGRHQIPIILYQPDNNIEQGVLDEVAQQIDIPATIIDYLNLPEKDKILPFGRSLLTRNNQADAVIKEEDAYWLISQGKYVKLSMDESVPVKTGDLPDTFIKPEHQAKSVDLVQLERRLKAYIQIYTNGLIDNSLYSFSPKNTQ